LAASTIQFGDKGSDGHPAKTKGSLYLESWLPRPLSREKRKTATLDSAKGLERSRCICSCGQQAKVLSRPHALYTHDRYRSSSSARSSLSSFLSISLREALLYRKCPRPFFPGLMRFAFCSESDLSHLCLPLLPLRYSQSCEVSRALLTSGRRSRDLEQRKCR